MADASLGGKTGFDLFGVKNLAGTFKCASQVYMPLAALESLPEKEIKSGLAELIKTLIICGGEDDLAGLDAAMDVQSNICADELFLRSLVKAVMTKGRIVEDDPLERGERRVLLNLGHTFGHALEAAAGLGKVSHGEAVAWGIVCACKLGCTLGLTPTHRASKIISLLENTAYETALPHPLAPSREVFFRFLGDDKKKKNAQLRFVVPDAESAVAVTMEDNNMKMIAKILGY
jgi:3-dehydroquinate synthase